MTMTITDARPAGGTYTPLGLFDIDRLLDDDERDIAATVRKFVDTRLRPNIEGWFESATLPKELAKEFGDLGVLGMHLDGYGCAGTNAVSYGLACLELEAGDEKLDEMMNRLIAEGVGMHSFADKDPTLEDVFMMVTKGLVV